MIAWRPLWLEAGRMPALCSPLVLLASIYALVRLLVDILVVRARSESERDLELKPHPPAGTSIQPAHYFVAPHQRLAHDRTVVPG